MEEHLWNVYKDEPSEENRNKLVEFYQPYVQTLVNNIVEKIPGYTTDDFINEVNISLIKNIGRFDTNRNIRFISFFTWRIRGTIADHLRELDFAPRHARQRKEQIPSFKSLDQKVFEKESGNNIYLKDIISKQTRKSNESYCFKTMIRSLNKIEKLILIMYYIEDMTMKQIGDNLRLSESRVSQIMTGAKNKLRNMGYSKVIA